MKWQVLAVGIRDYIRNSLRNLSAETVGWMAVIVLHAATMPALLALMTGLSDRTPGLDMVAMLWGGLLLLFVRAIILKDMLNIVTIGLGFVVQAMALAMILFK